MTPPGFTDVSDVMGLDRSDLSEADKVVYIKEDGSLMQAEKFTVTTKTGKVKVKINKKGSGPEETVIIDDMELYSFLKGAKASTKQAQYYATKSGKIAKNKWVNVGTKDYYCGSSGKITKTKKHIINNT